MSNTTKNTCLYFLSDLIHSTDNYLAKISLVLILSESTNGHIIVTLSIPRLSGQKYHDI